MIGLFAAALLQAAAAEPPAATIVNPDWQRFPSGEDVSKYYPKAAIKADLAGRVVVSCRVGVDGRLTACAHRDAVPADAGFGEAAVAMAQDVMRMRPETRDGQPVAGGEVSVPIIFIKPADLRTSTARVRHPEIRAEVVELDCRFVDTKLDNCIARGGSSRKVKEVAVALAEQITLPGLPTKRRQGRIVIPLAFTDEGGAIATPELVTRPYWLRRPSLDEVYRGYPDAARAGAPVATVVTECRIAANGELEACATQAEDPAGQGFGAAALALMGKFRMADVDAFGLKVAGRKIRVPIRFSPAAPPTRP